MYYMRDDYVVLFYKGLGVALARFTLVQYLWGILSQLHSLCVAHWNLDVLLVRVCRHILSHGKKMCVVYMNGGAKARLTPCSLKQGLRFKIPKAFHTSMSALYGLTEGPETIVYTLV